MAEKDICLARKVDVNLGNNIFQKFDIWHNGDGTLELVPFTNIGDPSDWSRVLNYSQRSEDYTLSSKWIGIDEEED